MMWSKAKRRLKKDLVQKIRRHMNWSGRKTHLWFSTPNPMLGGSAPDLLIVMGRGHKVKQYVEAVIREATF